MEGMREAIYEIKHEGWSKGIEKSKVKEPERNLKVFCHGPSSRIGSP